MSKKTFLPTSRHITLPIDSVTDIPKFLRLKEDGQIVLQLREDHTSDIALIFVYMMLFIRPDLLCAICCKPSNCTDIPKSFFSIGHFHHEKCYNHLINIKIPCRICVEYPLYAPPVLIQYHSACDSTFTKVSSQSVIFMRPVQSQTVPSSIVAKFQPPSILKYESTAPPATNTDRLTVNMPTSKSRDVEGLESTIPKDAERIAAAKDAERINAPKDAERINAAAAVETPDTVIYDENTFTKLTFSNGSIKLQKKIVTVQCDAVYLSGPRQGSLFDFY